MADLQDPRPLRLPTTSYPAQVARQTQSDGAVSVVGVDTDLLSVAEALEENRAAQLGRRLQRTDPSVER